VTSALTLAISTYERPDALAAVLETVASQSVAPDEVIIADDGSGETTRAVFERFAKAVSYPVHFVRQPHEGFRLARLRNLAIARAASPCIVFVDGDMLLHRHFIADHRRVARPGYFTQGVRVPLSPSLTSKVLEESTRAPGFLSPGLGLRRRVYNVHSPALARVMRGLANGLISIKGSNQAFWREDLVAVNGFNEVFIGWGSEDKELVERLANRGTRRQTLLFGGIAYHLHHEPASRERRAVNERVLEETRARRLTRCGHGLDAHT
jgi:glycosyltransferase involved in cell wall biosynthesis